MAGEEGGGFQLADAAVERDVPPRRIEGAMPPQTRADPGSDGQEEVSAAPGAASEAASEAAGDACPSYAAPRPRLRAMRGGQGAWREAEMLLLREGMLVAGCTPECDLVVSDEASDEGVAREHAWLRVEGLLCYLRDGSSTFGAKSAARTHLRPVQLLSLRPQCERRA